MTNAFVNHNTYRLALKCLNKHMKCCNIILTATILDVILNISKCLIEPEWHQSDSESVHPGEQKVNTKTTINIGIMTDL